MTSWRDARPLHLLRLPTDGWAPFIAAAGTAGFFLLLTAELAWPAFACAVVAIVAILGWLWDSDQAAPLPLATVADGVQLPTSATGRSSHSWWAVVILIAVDMTVFASFVFSHLHVSMAADICPPAGATLPATRWPVVAGILMMAGSFAMVLATRALRSAEPRRQRLLRALVLLALACTAGGIGLDMASQIGAGLDPTAQAWSATVGVFLGYGVFHGAVLALMGGYLLVRSSSGRLQPSARATLDNTALLWHCVTAQGVIAMLAVHLMPRLT